VRAAGGLISFSQFFLSGLFNGESLGAAFATPTPPSRVRAVWCADAATGTTMAMAYPIRRMSMVCAARRVFGGRRFDGEEAPLIGAVTPACMPVAGCRCVVGQGHSGCSRYLECMVCDHAAGL